MATNKLVDVIKKQILSKQNGNAINEEYLNLISELIVIYNNEIYSIKEAFANKEVAQIPTAGLAYAEGKLDLLDWLCKIIDHELKTLGVDEILEDVHITKK